MEDLLPLSLKSFPCPPHTYAGIGSRSAPSDVLELMHQLGRALAFHGLTLRSGGAAGADAAFEAGCDEVCGKKEIFLPWKGFNRNPSPYHAPPEAAETVAARYHPNWSACTTAARKLHARNVQQIYGLDLTALVRFVLFWAPEKNGRIEGGTATAIALAREARVPTCNLWRPTTFETFCAFIRQVEASDAFRLRGAQILRSMG